MIDPAEKSVGSSNRHTGELDSWVRVALDSKASWKDRRKAVTNIGLLAQGLKDTAFDSRKPPSIKQGASEELAKLLNYLGDRKFVGALLGLATDNTLGEALRRTAAWVLSEINDWPSYFNQKVLCDKKLQSNIAIDASLVFLPEMYPSGIESTKPDDIKLDIKLAEDFLPHLDGKGLELLWDTRKFYVGPFFRVLNYPGTDKRRKCIQYLYIWSRQVWPISAFFTFYLWPLLSALSIIPWLNNGSEIAYVTVGLMAILLIAIGTIRTLRPRELKSFKNDTFHVAGGGLLLTSLFLLPIGAIIPLIAAAILFLVRKYVLREIEHVMDYAPVFVYLKKNSDRWNFDRVRIDKFHYEALELDVKRNDQNGFLDPSKDLSTHLSADRHSLYLETDNIWHSFKFAKFHEAHSSGGYHLHEVAWVALYASTSALVGSKLLRLLLPVLFQFLPDVNGLLLLVCASLGALALIILNERATTPISDPSNPSLVSRFFQESEKRVLVRSKLAHLWNMSDEKANLIIRKKIQNPWRTSLDTPFWSTFRDPSAERLAYEALSEVHSLKAGLPRKSKVRFTKHDSRDKGMK